MREGSEERSICGLAGEYEEVGCAREGEREEGAGVGGWGGGGAIPEGIRGMMDTLCHSQHPSPF